MIALFSFIICWKYLDSMNIILAYIENGMIDLMIIGCSLANAISAIFLPI